MKKDTFLPYMVIVGVVAIVAIVALFLSSGKISGAQITEHVEEDYANCVDTDPTHDFYKAGAVMHRQIQYNDYCLNGRLLYQHYCDSNEADLFAPYECPNGCLNGACLR